MKALRLLCSLVLLGCLPGKWARADIGWTREDYAQRVGSGERGYAEADEMGYQLGDSRLVAEFNADRSVAEVWLLGVKRTVIPKRVLEDGDVAALGRQVKRVEFKARSAIAAEIGESVIGEVIVRADVRNRLVNRVAYCGRLPACSWWRRLLRWCPEEYSCDILDRVLQIDQAMDRLQVRAEQALR